MISTSSISDLTETLKALKLSVFANDWLKLAENFETDGRSHSEFLSELAQREFTHRHQSRIQRLLKQAKLPRMKSLQEFEMARIPGLSPSIIQRLSKGEFMENYENIIIFGNPGTGKTHLCIALAQEWCLLGRKVLFLTAANLVQQLLQAKQTLQLEQIIKKLERYEVLIIDDISYVPFERHETDVLFTLLSARYETRSVVITSNQPFAKWDTIFKDEMTTSAAIDRLVHHSTILELNTESYRVYSAQASKKRKAKSSKPQED